MIPQDIQEKARRILSRSPCWDEAAIQGLFLQIEKLLRGETKLFDYFYPSVTLEDVLCETHLIQLYYEARSRIQNQ